LRSWCFLHCRWLCLLLLTLLLRSRCFLCYRRLLRLLLLWRDNFLRRGRLLCLLLLRCRGLLYYRWFCRFLFIHCWLLLKRNTFLRRKRLLCLLFLRRRLLRLLLLRSWCFLQRGWLRLLLLTLIILSRRFLCYKGLVRLLLHWRSNFLGCGRLLGLLLKCRSLLWCWWPLCLLLLLIRDVRNVGKVWQGTRERDPHAGHVLRGLRRNHRRLSSLPVVGRGLFRSRSPRGERAQPRPHGGEEPKKLLSLRRRCLLSLLLRLLVLLQRRWYNGCFLRRWRLLCLILRLLQHRWLNGGFLRQRWLFCLLLLLLLFLQWRRHSRRLLLQQRRLLCLFLLLLCLRQQRRHNGRCLRRRRRRGRRRGRQEGADAALGLLQCLQGPEHEAGKILGEVLHNCSCRRYWGLCFWNSRRVCWLLWRYLCLHCFFALRCWCYRLRLGIGRSLLNRCVLLMQLRV